ncbi:MAG TPA: dienelactone hydrolase family protein, partial [Acidimicrobiales bacterium]|nr:dienelactone hydrolase family protein [Acidimicrobiales bacterium]
AVGKQKYAYRITQFLPKLIDSFIPKTFPDAVAEDAYAGLPVAAGAFPVVMFSHGFTGYPAQSSFLTAHLATWGFIVVSPEMTDMDVADAVEGKLPDVSKTAVAQKMLADNVSQQEAALDYVVAQGTTAGSLFDGHVNAGEVAFVGHSYGGATAVETARADSRIKVVVSLAGVPTTPLPRSIPILFMTGTYDQTIPTKDVVSFYDQFKPGKALLEIDDTGHNVFDDICTVNHAHGGIPGAITSLHLPVPKGLLVAATDGCNAPDVYPPLAWPLIDEATTAYLMYGFGIDKTLTGLGSGIDHLFAVTTSFQAG